MCYSGFTKPSCEPADNTHLNPSTYKVDAGGAGVKASWTEFLKPILGNSQLSVIPVPKSPTPSSGLQVHKAHMGVYVCMCTYVCVCVHMHTDIHTGRNVNF